MELEIRCKDCAKKRLEIEETGLHEVVSCEPLPGQDDVPDDERKCKIVWKIK